MAQYELKLKKETEDKKVFDAIITLQNCDDYELRKKYQHHLIELLCARDYKIESLPEFPIDSDIKILIRADLDSYLPRVNSQDLSASYAQALNENQSNNTKFLDTHYQKSMQESDSWKIIRQFSSFQKVYKHIVKKLLTKQINPDVVEKMTLKDCMHFVHKNCKSSFKEYSLKKKFVQTFIRYNEQELRKMHHSQGVDIRYTNAMVNAMKNDGISCGIQIFDEKGKQIKGPEYHIHHRIPVKHAGEAKYFSEVNLFKNLVLIEKEIYHKLIHICESSEYVADKRYFSKILPPENSALISGLKNKDVIYYDFQNRIKILNPALEAIDLPEPRNDTYACASKDEKFAAKTKNNFYNRNIAHKKGGGRRG